MGKKRILGLSELNFDFGFVGLFLFLGPPFLLLILFAWLIDEIILKIQSLRFKINNIEGWTEETKYLNEKFERKRQFEERFPFLTKLKKLLVTLFILVAFLIVTFLWGWFVLTFLD